MKRDDSPNTLSMSCQYGSFCVIRETQTKPGGSRDKDTIQENVAASSNPMVHLGGSKSKNQLHNLIYNFETKCFPKILYLFTCLHFLVD